MYGAGHKRLINVVMNHRCLRCLNTKTVLVYFYGLNEAMESDDARSVYQRFIREEVVAR